MKFLFTALCLFPASSFAAPGAHVSYHPVNLTDNNPTTLWCAHFRDGGVRVQLQLLRPRNVDSMLLTPAARGAKTVSLVHVNRDGEGYDVGFEAQSPAELALRPAHTRSINVAVREVAAAPLAGDLGADVFCLSDIALYDHGELVDPSEITVVPERLSEQVVGGWQREGASKKSSILTFNLDGTWQMTPARGKKLLKGTYELASDRIVMRRPGRRSALLMAQVDRVSISGEGQENQQDSYSILVLHGTGDTKIDGKYVVRGASGI